MATRCDETLRAMMPGATFKRRTRELAIGNGDFGHSHEASAITRGQHEDAVLKRARQTGSTSIAFIGCSNREQRKLGDADHGCETKITAHDLLHQAFCCDHRTCTAQVHTIYSNDMIYYMSPQQIADSMRQHGAERYLGTISAPFYGGGGLLYKGEGGWVAKGGGMVEAITDFSTMEVWYHSDMLWLLESNSRKLADGDWVAWNPYYVGGDRMTYVFVITDKQPLPVKIELATLDSWVAGTAVPPPTFHHRDVAYSAKQVAKALRLSTYGVSNELIVVAQVLNVCGWLETNPQLAPKWPILAAQRARSLKAADVTVTVELALYLARRKLGWMTANSWRILTTERRMYYGDLLSYVKDCCPPSWAVAAAVAVAAGVAVATMPRVRTAAVLAGGAAASWVAARTPAPTDKYVEYKYYDIMEVCQPFVGEYETERGSLYAEDSFCECKAAFGLAGIAIHPEYLTTSCGCNKTLATAFIERILNVSLPITDRYNKYGMGEPREATFDELKSGVPEACSELRAIMGISSGVLATKRPTFKEWSSRPCFSANSRAELEAARNEGETLGFGRANAFVKKEIILKPGTEGTGGDKSKPRSIQPIERTTRAAIGVSIYGYTHGLKFIFSGDSSCYFTSGCTGEMLGSWFDLKCNTADGPVAFMNADYSNFDGTQFLDVGQTVVFGVKALLGMPLNMSYIDCSRWRSRAIGFGGRTRYGGAETLLKQVSPSMSSGHDDTTAGNSSANAVVHGMVMRRLYGDVSTRRVAEYTTPEGWVNHDNDQTKMRDPAVALAYKFATTGTDKVLPVQEILASIEPTITIDQPVYPASVMIMGDDGLAIIPAQDSGRYLSTFNYVSEGFGYQPKAEVVHSPWEVEFCSMLMWPSADGTVAGPKIGRIMARTGFKRIGDKAQWLKQLRGDALGLAVGCSHVPILRAWIAKLLVLTGSKHIDNPLLHFKPLAQTRHSATDESWVFASARYGLNRSVLEELEQQISSVTNLPACLHHPAWDVIVRRDA